MPKISRVLLSTDRQVAAAKPPPPGKSRAEYRIAGTPNLVLRVSPSGRRVWVYWIKRPKANRWQKFTIDEYPAKTLSGARADAIRLKGPVLDDHDPIENRNTAKGTLTVYALGCDYMKRHAKPKQKSWADDERKLKREVYPALGHARVDQVTKADLVVQLNDIHDRGAPILANRTLALLRKLFNWAVAEGYLETSTASGIPSRALEKARTRPLSPSELLAFWRALDSFEIVTADQLLLGAPVREITGIARTELSIDALPPVWSLPKARAKAGRDVPRPLPPPALSIISRRIKASCKSP